MTEEAPPPKRIRREEIALTTEPGEGMVESLQAQFEAMPRIAEAWLTASRLSPEDGSPSYETTDIHLVLDPPIDRHNDLDLRAQVEEVERAFEATGWRSEPHRGCVFAATSPRRPFARRIYSRST